MSNKNVAPFVKWAGGKRQLLDKILERMPQCYNNYFEPFIGGGAVLFKLQPETAVINDINASLINAYRIIADNPQGFIAKVSKLDAGMGEDVKTYYYSVDEESILAVSEYLKKATILHGDFEEVCRDAKKGDFIFFDSPYVPLNPTSFESYTKEGFDVESHLRLARLFDELTKRGCYCMLTNHNTNFINELYGNKGYRIDVVSVKRMINSDASKRTGEEVIICNY